MKISAYYETSFLLSRVAFLKNDTLNCLKYMGDYLDKNPGSPQAINNYILMLIQHNESQKARTFIQKKQSEHIAVPQELINLLNQK
jgi:hypothetical protein